MCTGVRPVCVQEFAQCVYRSSPSVSTGVRPVCLQEFAQCVYRSSPSVSTGVRPVCVQEFAQYVYSISFRRFHINNEIALFQEFVTPSNTQGVKET